MRFLLYLFFIIVSAVLYDANQAPVIEPWKTFKMPATAQACAQSQGHWMTATHGARLRSIEEDKPAHCELQYPDQGKACKTADACTSRVCIMHPNKAAGSCFGMLPPRGRFDFLDAKGVVRSARFPL